MIGNNTTGVNTAGDTKNTMTHWIMSAKQEATRVSRLGKTISVSEHEKRMQ